MIELFVSSDEIYTTKCPECGSDVKITIKYITDEPSIELLADEPMARQYAEHLAKLSKKILDKLNADQ